jgi:L-alanine-DL-glutamate epimerase-like enolase superfamily enzyme
MRITGLRLTEVQGYPPFGDEFWEERLVQPVDVYPDQRMRGPAWLPRDADGRSILRQVFLEVLTDEEVAGLAGPIDVEQAFHIARQLTPLLIGQEALAHERLWDRLYRFAVHGRKGVVMQAISAIDCALWDLKGKWAGAPVYRLLGGPLRDEIPAYASALGYSVEPEAAARRVQEIIAQGYRATKWFFRHGPGEGAAGLRRNLDLARALRTAIGDEVDLMLDCWMSWDVPYALAAGAELAELRPRWLEEPVPPDRIESCAELRRRLPFPIATGEHEYTRWGLKQLLDAGAADVIQPDIYWAGGLSETVKICALASTYDVQVIPHGHSTHATAHLLYAQPPQLCPYIEYLLKWNQINQYFFREQLEPVNGMVVPPDRPGLGVELDETKIERRRELRWD